MNQALAVCPANLGPRPSSVVKALIQRVTRASVTVADHQVAGIGKGLVILLGVAKADTEADPLYLVDKIANLRVFPDDHSHFNHSALETKAELLVVSQITLCADTRKGRRPDFSGAAPPAEAERLYQRAVELFQESGLSVATGVFQEHMQVSLQNDGPVTIMLDSADRHRPRRG